MNPLIPPSIFSIINANTLDNKEDLQANTSNLDIQHTIDFAEKNRLTYGLNYRFNQVSSDFLNGDGREDRLGLYIQDEWKITSLLTAVTGLRFDMNSFINPQYSPRFSVVYKPIKDHTVRTGFAIAYRSPTIFEERTLSLGSIFGNPSTMLVGSHETGPEKIVSYDLGYQGWYWKHRIKARVDVFFNHITDLIGDSVVATGSPTSTFFNGGSFTSGGGTADIYGGEAGIEFLAFPWLSGFANVAYQDIGQTYPSSNRVRRGAPHWKVNGGLRSDFENGINGEAVLHYVGPAHYGIDPGFAALSSIPGVAPPPNTRVGSYVLLNLRGAFRFWRDNGKDKAELAISVFNALNDKHKEHPLGETIKSRVMGWLTIKH
jgi:iron complex outermembrane receptor protein